MGYGRSRRNVLVLLVQLLANQRSHVFQDANGLPDLFQLFVLLFHDHLLALILAIDKLLVLLVDGGVELGVS